MTEKEKLVYWEEKGINTGIGLKYADDDFAFYEQLIGIFLEEYTDKREKLKQFATDDIKEYAVLVHGLKNNAKALGAERLGILFWEHEKAAKAEDRAYIAKELAGLLRTWDETIHIFQTE